MRNWLAFALLLLPAVVAAAPSRPAVEKLLGGYEINTTADDLKRLGDGVDHVLCAIAIDPKVSRLRRNRALSALAAVPSVEGKQLLLFVLHDKARATEGADELDLHSAIVALAAFGPEVSRELVPFLAHESSDIREASAKSLAVAHAKDAVSSLRMRLTVERDDTVLRVVRDSVIALEREN
jgi:hypothetical protein